jgi:hypothetical protein
MGRVLIATRVRVAPAAMEEYLRLSAEYAAALRVGGRRVWVFRSRTDPASFLEFVEGEGPVDPRAGLAEHLHERLIAIAPLRDGAEELWDEIP